MFERSKMISVALTSLCLAVIAGTVEQAFGLTIPTVPVGNAGNTGEVQSQGTFGAVAYNYRIGATEVTNAQYVDFLNAVATTDTYELYSALMEADVRGGITRSGSSGSYSYSIKGDAGTYTYANKPVVHVSWGDAVRFANWLHNGQPTGAQDASTTEDGAYTLNGAISAAALNTVIRNSGAIWFLTSEDEWYKAAYYDGSAYHDYPTSTDATPDNNLPSLDSGNSANFYDGGYTTGSSTYQMTDAGAYTLSGSPYGTFDQGGNVWEWNEALISGSLRGLRGGSFDSGAIDLQSSHRGTYSPTNDSELLGFRVATIPEPSTRALAILGILSMAASCVRRGRSVQSRHRKHGFV